MNLVRLSLADGSTIDVTDSHLFWSLDRLDWVAAGELQPGERLDGQDGAATVADVQPLGHAPAVYNLEVHGQHVYRVAESGVLVHNTNADCPGAIAAPASVRRTESGIVWGRYGDTSGRVSGQMHHVNQDAAFGRRIPTDDATAVQVFGSVFGETVDPTSRHFRLHQHMELAFWDHFRFGTKNTSIADGARAGAVPTVREYNRAVFEAATYAGFNKDQVRDIVRIAVRDQRRFGIHASELVPDVPERIYSVRVPLAPL